MFHHRSHFWYVFCKRKSCFTNLGPFKVINKYSDEGHLGKTDCFWFQKAIGKDPHYQHSREIDCHWRRVLACLNNRTKDREQGSSKWSVLTVEGHNQQSSPGTCPINVFTRDEHQGGKVCWCYEVIQDSKEKRADCEGLQKDETE